MSTELHQSISTISYLIGGYVLLLGFGVLFWNPLADQFGRRPVTIMSMTIAVCATCGVASAETYGTMMAGRVFQGFGVCGGLSLGAAYINDMYSPSEKGRIIGIWTLGITIGPFLSPLVGGFIAYYTSYRWILWLCAILLGLLLFLQIACLPEAGSPHSQLLSFPSLVDFATTKQKDLAQRRQERGAFISFVQLYRTTLLVPVWLVGMVFVVPYSCMVSSLRCFYHGSHIISLQRRWGRVNNEPVPVIYGELYGLDERAQGLLYIPLLIGSLIAEAIAGRTGDWIVYRGHQVSSTGEESDPPLERRLIIAHCGITLSIVGLLWFGIATERHDHWASLAVSSGIAACGIQVMTSICYSYILDCYPLFAKETATVLNLFRALGSFIVLFYNQQLVSVLGEGWGFGVQCFMIAFFSYWGAVYSQLLRSADPFMARHRKFLSFSYPCSHQKYFSP
ncbi:major facilitator superfamily domain-containing protein [Melanogaster broomeanus]|nr:major facilitator superfamily domain-containing protein [Melanogaster broomeanus]